MKYYQSHKRRCENTEQTLRRQIQSIAYLQARKYSENLAVKNLCHLPQSQNEDTSYVIISEDIKKHSM